MFLVGAVNLPVCALLVVALVLGPPPRESLLLAVLVSLAGTLGNVVAMFLLKPRVEEQLRLDICMAELRKRLTVAGVKTITNGSKPPLSRQTLLVVVAANVVGYIYVLTSLHDVFGYDQFLGGALLALIPSAVTLVVLYRLWASDDLSVLRREDRRAALRAQLKATQE
jgi:hypothetical protein